MDILVLIHRAFSDQRERVSDGGEELPQKLAPILEYIDLHLQDSISLELLEKQFYVNRHYLNRLFKSYTGSTIHEYIIYKRIATAKRLLVEGSTVTESCLQSGFNDYTAFSRMFKKRKLASCIRTTREP
ncbi:helix-turn-helix transcriptional regulator (plasmid) [Paenibacillus rhizovicinus]|uniref:Helix-turn-helix transcriptional regulator n=1 Tax=Paenibacillus rhizovicinus TaxID=2704463 RepID=A0A6C0PAX4_9BACL|nr:helix-turn-helix transcriptional regulator [Paenibacillus rhizovicinus]